MRIAFAILASLSLTLPPARAQDGPPPVPQIAPEEAERIGVEFQKYMPRVMSAMTKMGGDWDQQVQLMMQAAEKIYERNDWTSEPHQFSLEVMRAVESKPPWAYKERMDTLMGMISDRYMLDEEQEKLVQRMFFETSMEVFQKHAGDVLKYTTEILETRANGDAFTPEKVAEWVKLAGPVMDDGQQIFMAKAEKFLENLDPEQQALVRRDLGAVQDRFDGITKMRQRWERGEWTASDWGMEEDPIQLEGERRIAEGIPPQTAEAPGDEPSSEEGAAAMRELIRRRIEERQRERAERGESEQEHDGQPRLAPQGRNAPAAGQDSAAQPAKKSDKPAGRDGRAVPDDPWARYVSDFISQYKLNDDQQQKCWSVYREATERRDALKSRITQRAGNDAQRKAAETKQKAAVDRIFEQMKRRLDRLPTRAQRQADEKSEKKKSPTTQMNVNTTESSGP